MCCVHKLLDELQERSSEELIIEQLNEITSFDKTDRSELECVTY